MITCTHSINGREMVYQGGTWAYLDDGVVAQFYVHGWPVVFRDGQRYYVDTGECAEGNPRPCSRCGRMPTPEGYDACLGYIPGAAGACCGHGVEPGYVCMQDGIRMPNS